MENPTITPLSPSATIPAINLPLVFGKQEVYDLLFPRHRSRRTWALRSVFFTDERLQRIRITPEQYGRIKVFTPDQCAAIRQELANLLQH